MNFPRAEGAVRSAIHHLIAGGMLSVYGYHVCNFINGLALATWIASLLPVLLAQWGARTVLAQYHVSLLPVASRPRQAFVIEFVAFAAGGALLGCLNVVFHGFPAGSGVKMVLGFVAVGLFAGADAAIARNLARFEDGGLDTGTLRVQAPFAMRVGAVTALMMALLTAISALLVMRAFDEVSTGGAASFKRVVVELLFVLCVFVAYAFNLVRGLGGLIGRALREQIDTLQASHAAVSGRRAVVATADEFGQITREINVLLDALDASNRDAARANETTIRGLVSLAGTRDDETGSHLRRTQRYVELIARSLTTDSEIAPSLGEEAIQLLRAAAPLHDIGKVGIPDRVLRKPGRLSDEEFALMRTHVVLGLNVVDGIIAEVGCTPFLKVARDVIAGHHERWDGNGYPSGHCGNDIPLAGRIMAVADVYDALRSSRVYKPAMSRQEARKVIVDGAGGHFDPRVATAFLMVEPEIARVADELSDKAVKGGCAHALSLVSG